MSSGKGNNGVCAALYVHAHNKHTHTHARLPPRLIHSNTHTHHHNSSTTTTSIAAIHHGFAQQLKPLLAELRSSAGGATPTLHPTTAGVGEDGTGGGNGNGKAVMNGGGGSESEGAPPPAPPSSSPLGGLASRALLQPSMVNNASVRVRALYMCLCRGGRRPSGIFRKHNINPTPQHI